MTKTFVWCLSIQTQVKASSLLTGYAVIVMTCTPRKEEKSLSKLWPQGAEGAKE